jgi:hypothetical protein
MLGVLFQLRNLIISETSELIYRYGLVQLWWVLRHITLLFLVSVEQALEVNRYIFIIYIKSINVLYLVT